VRVQIAAHDLGPGAYTGVRVRELPIRLEKVMA
jgi:hypothetical protein